MSTPGGDSRLDDSVLEFIGKRICARTFYGWGWAEGDNERTNSVPVQVPTSFHFKLLNSSIGMTKGAVASDILKNRHIFMTVIGCCFTCANAAILIFFSKIAEYNFHIGRNRPSLFPPSKNPQMAEAWPLPNFPNCSSVWGFGRIGMTTDVIINFEEERLKKWQLERDDSKK